jgi:hypothetical protein
LPFLEEQFRTRDPVYLEKLLLLTGDLARSWKAKESSGDAAQIKRLQPLAGRYLEHPLPRVRSAAILASAPFLDRKAILQLQEEYKKETDPIVLARWRSVYREFVLQ